MKGTNGQRDNISPYKRIEEDTPKPKRDRVAVREGTTEWDKENLRRSSTSNLLHEKGKPTDGGQARRMQLPVRRQQ